MMLELRPLEDRDVALVEIWLNREHVKKWYEIPRMGVSIDDWMEEIRERRGAFHWLNHLILWKDGRPVGMCQYYACRDSGEEFGGLAVEGSYGIDYLIGEEAELGKGLGREMLRLLVGKIFSLPGAQRVTADIDRENKASEGVLLSCGFVLWDAESSRYVLERRGWR